MSPAPETKQLSPFALRYRTDPEFRKRKLELQAKYRGTRDKQRQRLQYLHRRIYELRESLQRHQEKVEITDRRLVKAVEERTRIQRRIAADMGRIIDADLCGL